MRIAIVGGTGKEGSGLGQRWAAAGHEIVIGSRDAERARAKAAEMAGRTPGARVSGMSNADAAKAADVVVLALPANGLQTTLPDVTNACRGKIVISAVVPLTFGGPRLFTPPAQGSSAEEAQELLGPEARVVAAFHHIAAHELQAGDHPIECDLLHCGGDAEAKKVVADLGASIGLRALDAGALSNAGPLEGITAVLATINRRYKVKNSGIKITGALEASPQDPVARAKPAPLRRGDG
jgi:NADPH-dependent F420 reductase